MSSHEKSKKKSVRIKYSTYNPDANPHANVKNKANYFEEQFYNTVFYEIIKKHFEVVYDHYNADFHLDMHHYDPCLHPDSVNIVFMTEDFFPNFNIYDYAIGFDYLTFEDRYVQFPYWMYCTYKGKNPLDIMHTKVQNYPAISNDTARELLQKKQQFCSFIVSNQTLSHPARIDFFHLLSAYKQVSSGGKVLNNTPMESKSAFQEKSKFAIVFENTSQNGYITEKIGHAFEDNTIPIYWGCPKIADSFNPKAFINCHDFSSFEAVVERVKEIDNNDDMWCEMIACKNKIRVSHADMVLQNLETFLITILSQNPKQAKRVNHNSIAFREAFRLWEIKNKHTLSLTDLEKIATLYKQKKEP